MKNIIIPLCILLIATAESGAACKWRYVNEINKDIKHASDLLSDYAKCKNDCTFLAKGLNRSLLHLGQSSQCGANILTRENGNAIGFIGDRYKLIYKQKTGKNWTSEEIGVPIEAAVGEFWNTRLTATKPVTPAPPVVKKAAQPQAQQRPKPAGVQKTVPRKAQQPSQPAPKDGQKIAISREAYLALWPEQKAQRQVPRKQHKHKAVAAMQQLAKQRAERQRKQLIIQQQLTLRQKVQKQIIQRRLNQQRLARIRLQQQRLQQARLERNRRIQQQRLIIAQRNRGR